MPDVVITPGNVKVNAVPRPLTLLQAHEIVTLGEAIDAGEFGYKSPSDEKVYKTNATDSAKPGDGDRWGILVSGGMAGQLALLGKVPGLVIDVGAGALTRAQQYVLSPNNGKFCTRADLAASTNEVQSVELSGGTSGNGVLTFDGVPSDPFSYVATAAELKTALEAASNIDLVATSGGPLQTAPITVEFQGVNAAKNVPQMTFDTSGIAGAPVGAVNTTTEGAGDHLAEAGYATSDRLLTLTLHRTGIKK